MSPAQPSPPRTVAIIGAGPAGLMAAEVLSAAGVRVTVFDRMPSAGRKLLMAGRGGLNLTHSEPMEAFLARYGAARSRIEPLVRAFPPDALRAWAEGLGQETFVGSSGRVFPKALKASPLLRAWLARLAGQGVEFRLRRRWTGWDTNGALAFEGETFAADAAVLALGGASWPRLGSDGSWAEILAARGVELAPFTPSNGGFDVAWSEVFRDRFAGEPLKTVALTFAGRRVRGEAMITKDGIEGGAVYALSAALRDAIIRDGKAAPEIDLRPDLDAGRIAGKLAHAPAGASMTSRLRKALNLPPVAIGLLREAHGVSLPEAPDALAAMIKRAPMTLTGVRPIERAISTAGGVNFDAVDETLQLKVIPGVWVAGEMLDWEAPTGGYLLQACFASGVAAAKAILA